ncbi:beta-2-microglobulin-like [Cheilinus undulatus]|uniref:beta-2-microglobulin-like n=1 Tax=Cheilinus undulatus TaxID=241271 RepID=UPI001BD42E9A|nr:beta-2-microglobulin-like [Cheilinus undulatus]
MKCVLLSCVVALVAVCSAAELVSKPKVQVYSRNRGEFGKENILICHVSEFYPPDLKIQLLKDGVEMKNCNQTDLTFHKNWHFHLTVSREFTPVSGIQYTCRVTHGNKAVDYAWESNM